MCADIVGLNRNSRVPAPSRPLSKWDVRLLSEAAHRASWSKDPSTKVGAVLAHNKRPFSYGYNGFPSVIPDKQEWLENREVKYPLTIHAEHNAVLSARECSQGATCYVWPIPPCAPCASFLIQEGVGIVRVVSLLPTQDQLSRWGAMFDLAYEVFKLAGVTVDLYHRQEVMNSEFWYKGD